MSNARLSLLALAALVAALPAAAGVYFSAVTTAEGAPGAAPASTTVRCWVEGDKARVEFTASADPLLRRGRYLLTLDGGRSVYLVDPTERTFSEWSGEAAIWTSAAAAKLPRGAVEKVDEGDGGELLGMKTVHVRYRAATVSASAAVEEELWVAPELAQAALGVWMRRAAADAGDGDAGAAADAERERLGCFPLKRVAVSTAAGRGSGKAPRRITTVVTELSVEDVSAGTFTMGSGFREKPLSASSGESAQQGQDVSEEFPAGGPAVSVRGDGPAGAAGAVRAAAARAAGRGAAARCAPAGGGTHSGTGGCPRGAAGGPGVPVRTDALPA